MTVRDDTLRAGGDAALPMRPAALVMDPRRLGALYAYRLSFMRTLVRRMASERWQIRPTRFDVDHNGFGEATYEVRTPRRTYSFAAFLERLEPGERNDRVIANRWDMTVALCEGRIDAARLSRLRQAVPQQEAGRLSARCLVLSRANKSERQFETVVGALAEGRQPALADIARVGYLYRTTAVYGSGKFGMADWRKVRGTYADFARPFAAELFTCYLIRELSLALAEHIARQRNPPTATALHPDVRRYFGIGNATGLGMAPFLINHPLLLSRWIEVRETALARVLAHARPDDEDVRRLLSLGRRAIRHLGEIDTDNAAQNSLNARTAAELGVLLAELRAQAVAPESWRPLVERAARRTGLQAQELLNALLIELYPALNEDLQDACFVRERHECLPEMSLQSLARLVEEKYDWALAIPFDRPETEAVFWYRSAEKMEPRLGRRGLDPGSEREIAIDVARSVRRCYDAVTGALRGNGNENVAEFLYGHPEHRRIVRRIQTMAATRYGEIRVNPLSADVMPIHLLRCKLSFFGVGKFDPKSSMWVRNTMFQGAPVAAELDSPMADDWCFPVMPVLREPSVGRRDARLDQ